MNTLKKLFGPVWIALGPVLFFYLVRTASAGISKKPVLDTKIQWGIFIVVAIPIVAGFVLFGYYAVKGEYGHGSEINEPETPEP